VIALASTAPRTGKENGLIRPATLQRTIALGEGDVTVAASPALPWHRRLPWRRMTASVAAGLTAICMPAFRFMNFYITSDLVGDTCARVL
jgi:hypothetical protein